MIKRFSIIFLLFMLKADSNSFHEFSNTVVDFTIDDDHLLNQHELRLIFKNKSNNILRLWAEGTSWGDDLVVVFVMRNNSKVTFIQRHRSPYTMNIPGYITLIQNQILVRNINFHDGSWISENIAMNFNFKKDDLVLVSYAVPHTEEAIQNHVWTGTISKEIKIQ